VTEFINRDNERLKTQMGGSGENFYQKCIIVLNVIAIYFYKFIYHFTFLAMFFYCFYDFSQNINTKTYMGEFINKAFSELDSIENTNLGERFSLLKICLLLIVGTFILTIFILLYIGVSDTVETEIDKANAPPEPSAPPLDSDAAAPLHYPGASAPPLESDPQSVLNKLSNNPLVQAQTSKLMDKFSDKGNKMMDSAFNKFSSKIKVPGKFGKAFDAANSFASKATAAAEKAQGVMDKATAAASKVEGVVNSVNETANKAQGMVNESQKVATDATNAVKSVGNTVNETANKAQGMVNKVQNAADVATTNVKEIGNTINSAKNAVNNTSNQLSKAIPQTPIRMI